jgi:hypothetical protein
MKQMKQMKNQPNMMVSIDFVVYAEIFVLCCIVYIFVSDDVAPVNSRTMWLSIFFSGMPIGGAMGYVAGGWFSKWNWHIGFLTEAAAVTKTNTIDIIH